MVKPKQFTVTLVGDHRRVFMPVPFDPDEKWGHKAERAARIAEVVALLAAGIKQR